MTQWLHRGQPIDELPEGTVGFVYIITNMTNGKRYIGKKLAQFSKTRYKMHTQKNGVKKRKAIRSKVESDWREYWGSSDALLKDIELLGEQNFKREILHFCKSKAATSYMEAKEQFLCGVLESPNYYNGNIQIRTHKNHIFGKL